MYIINQRRLLRTFVIHCFRGTQTGKYTIYLTEDDGYIDCKEVSINIANAFPAVRIMIFNLPFLIYNQK